MTGRRAAADGLKRAAQHFVVQRQGGRGLDDNAEFPHRMGIAQQEPLDQAAVEQRAGLAVDDFFFDHGPHFDRRQGTRSSF